MKLGIVGLGFIAVNEYLPVLMQLKEIDIVCVVDPDQDKLQTIASKYRVGKVTSSIDDLLNMDIDAALVLTPYQVTYDLVRKLLARGIDVLSEKPMAETIEQAEELVLLGESKHAIYMIGLNRRFAASFVHAKQVLQTSQIELISVEKVKHMTYYRDKPLMDFGIHALDTMLWLSEGRVTNCLVDSSFTPDGRESMVQAQFTFDNGIKGRFMMTGNAGKWEETVNVYGQATTVQIQAPSVVKVMSGGETTEQTFGMAGPGAGGNSFGFKQQLLHFTECVRTRAVPATTGRVALYTQQVMDMMYKQMGK